MRLIIIESPYAGEIERNTRYAREAMRDAIYRGEAPIASHLLYTQEGILDDNVPGDRKLGIACGLAWARVAEGAAFYTDLGWSTGMNEARHFYEEHDIPFVTRAIR